MAFTSGTDWSFRDLSEATKDETDADKSNVESDTPTESEAQASSHDQPPQREQLPPRQCRICLELVYAKFQEDAINDALPKAFQGRPRMVYASEDGGRLLTPCRCKGTQKYVHEDCLSSWRRADPLQKRNYFQCPTCHYKYRLQRLTWASWLSSTISQIALTLVIFVISVFLLGFVADPIINLYLDPITTIATGGGPSGSLIFEDEPASWTEHFLKGAASLGLLGIVKLILSLSTVQYFSFRGTNLALGRSNSGGSGRDRISQTTLLLLCIGVATFLVAVWKGVRAWSRKTLEHARERVLDVHHDDDDDDPVDFGEPK